MIFNTFNVRLYLPN